MSADREEGTVARPLYAGYTVIWPDITQLGHFAVLGGPEVDAGAEADGEDVLRRPVDQIKVKVVLQARCVEYLERLLRDYALFPVLLGQQLLLLREATVDRKFKNTLPASLLKKMHPWKLAYEKKLSKKQKRVRDSFKLFAVAFLCT